MKKIMLSVALLCIVCFLFGSCANGNSTTSHSQADSSDPVSDIILNKESSSDPESTEPLDAPAVVTRSHMVEKVGEDADLIQEALKLYAGQDTKYCVKVSVECDSDTSFNLDFFNLAAELYRTQCYCEGFPGITGADRDDVEKYQNGLYGTFYVDEEKQFEFWLTANYAELPEAALRAVLECNGTSVQLIDEIPENTATIAVFVDA